MESIFLIEVQYNERWHPMQNMGFMFSRSGAELTSGLIQAGIDMKAVPYKAVRVSEFQRVEEK